MTQARPRADCCTPGVCFYHLCLTFCFAHSSRANEAGQTTCGLLHTCSLPIIIYFLGGSPFRTKFTCERGCHFPYYYTLHRCRMFHVDSYKVHVRTGLIFYLFIPIAQSSRANGVDISVFIPIAQSSRANGVDTLLIYTYSTKFTCERGWYFIYLVSGRYFCMRGDVLGYVFVFHVLADCHVSTYM